MIMDPIRYALVGIGGYGESHLKAIEAMEADGVARLVAVIERNVEGLRGELDRLAARGVANFADLAEWLAVGGGDVVAIAAGIPWHRPLAVQALQAGYHLYLEKPPTVTIQDHRAVEEAARAAGRAVQTGFQFASGRPFHELRGALAQGAVGAVREIVGAGCWQRDDSYYQRNAWAGEFRLGDLVVMDGSLSNPLAHLLHIMLLLAAGAEGPESALPVQVEGELYHAHPIVGEDLAAARITTRNGVRLCIATTTAADRSDGPWLEVRGTRGAARWDIQQTVTINGERREYAQAEWGSTETLFRNLTGFLRGEATGLMNPLTGSEPFVLALDGVYESSQGIHAIAAEHVRRFPTERSLATQIAGLTDLLQETVRRLALPSEMGVPWAVPGRLVSMSDYREFAWERYPAAR